MKLPYSVPHPAGTERARAAKKLRDLATEVARKRPHAITRDNAEEQDHGPLYPSNFTKGLLHDDNGLLAHAEDYRSFVEGVNTPDRNYFETHVRGAHEAAGSEADLFRCTVDGETPSWRGWESPRAGHVYELEGPDAGAVGMAPAPRVGSSELAAEMAEVYALALLRDVPFHVIEAGGEEQICVDGAKAGKALLGASAIVDALNSMPFFRVPGGPAEELPTSSTPLQSGDAGLNRFEAARRIARTGSRDAALTTKSVFRGSTRGAQAGPYLSQFLLIGSPGRGNGACDEHADESHPGSAAAFGLESGLVPYGTAVIDQRNFVHKACVDHMTQWSSWLDVQNGASLAAANLWECERRFLTTPRDLATYVHYDALYEAYLNAAILLLNLEVPAAPGFPEPSPTGKRTGFATFGGPHVLSLVTEVATRCLKAVRRQKFNYHRRARPEALGGRLTLAQHDKSAAALGNSRAAFEATLEEIPEKIRDAIHKHNSKQNTAAMRKMRSVTCDKDELPDGVKAGELMLLPMAFSEGSPMHPAYGAGHATVAGGCVTMLKAFFDMFNSGDSTKLRELRDAEGQAIAFRANDTGSALVQVAGCEPLTIEGELDKLAANISIGRNMAGVHYYSDYYDSLRMGERIAVGILLEQAPTYGESIETRFHSFDGDLLTISGEAGAAPSLSVQGAAGEIVDPRDWWLRHTMGEEEGLDL